MSPRDLGKWAKLTGINAPSLDSAFYCWIKNATEEQRTRYCREWWEGWFDAVDESLSFRNDRFTKVSAS